MSNDRVDYEEIFDRVVSTIGPRIGKLSDAAGRELDSLLTRLAPFAREEDRIRALAQFASLSAVVPKYIVAELSDHALETPPELLADFVAHARKDPILRRPLVRRHSLPPYLLTRLYFFVSPGLKREILERARALVSAYDAKTTDDQRQSAHRLAPANDDETNNRIAAELRQCLADNRRDAYALKFASFAGVKEPIAEMMTTDPTFQPIALACRASGVSTDSFRKLIAAAVSSGYGSQKASDTIVALYERLPIAAVKEIVQLWRLEGAALDDEASAPNAESDNANDNGLMKETG